MANLTIRGLDEAIKATLRVEAAKQGQSMEETARQILRRALMGSGKEAGGLGTRAHGYFLESGAVDLELPERSAPRAAPDFTRQDA
ncbi:MAG: FitA-like ribbon-helix-helix domain-containing protein [Thermoleophilia bacterium]